MKTSQRKLCGGRLIPKTASRETHKSTIKTSTGNSDQRSYGTALLFAVCTMVLAGFSIRIAQLGMQSLWYDEGFSVYLSGQDLATITARTAADIHPPLYYYLLHFWLTFTGDLEFSVRYLSLFWGVLTIPVLAQMSGKVYQVLKGGAGETGGSLFLAVLAFITTLLAALNPALVYYSQEARMYSLLLFLTVMGSYSFLNLLLDSGSDGRKTWAWSIALVVTNVAAIYAHFYAFFILGAQMTFLIFWLLPSVRSRLSHAARLLTLFIITSLLYLPWAGFTLTRLGADVSYYQGILEPSVLLGQTFNMFATGVSFDENSFNLSAILMIALASMGIVVISFLKMEGTGRHDRFMALSFLILYLILPFVFLYLVSYNRPKFHPRYLLIALPPVLALISIAASWLIANLKLRVGIPLRGLIGIAFVVIPLLSSVQSLWFLTNDVKNVRDDWRAVGEFLTEQALEGDTIVLMSGHAFPVFAHYYRKDNWVPIPDEYTLSTENTITFDVANTLNASVEGKTSLWVVRWQDNVVDPNGILKRMLDANTIKQEIKRGFKGIKLDHYLLPPGTKFKAEPDIQKVVGINYDNRIKLLGFDGWENKPAKKEEPLISVSGKNLDLTLYWQALTKLSEDYSVSLRVRDSENHFWGRVDRRPTDYYYLTQRWKVGEVIFGDYSLPLLPGTPPGEYVIEAEVYTRSESGNKGVSILNEFGAPMGTSGILGKIRVDSPVVPSSLQDLNIQKPVSRQFGGLELLGYNETGVNEIRQGSSFPMVLHWRAAEKMEKELNLVVELVSEDGEVVAANRFQPAKKEYPTSYWQVGEVILGQYDFRLPAGAKPGVATVKVSIYDGERSLGESVPVQKIFIRERPRSSAVPNMIQNPLDITFDNKIKLIGYDIEPQHRRLKAGEALKLTLYWEAQSELSRNLVVFNHLLNGVNLVAGQHDGVPNEGNSPTTSWLEGEIVVDIHKIQLKPETSPGVYVIENGLYEPTTGLRLRTQYGDDRILLGEVRVE